jgi:hypothetical protein
MYVEEEALHQYEQEQNLQQADIQAAGQSFDEQTEDGALLLFSVQSSHGLTNCFVCAGTLLCPMCQQRYVFQVDGGRVFRCTCGFRLNAQVRTKLCDATL